ncbi:hypothetical protein PT974_08278 [Cladobotryum mycophilum]|uniref:Uncharacterized protein n=1 Tax=Cladobotryum mycophilum TaxID=491253 RepID=A0ABR0SDZ1_9HYPO
MSSRPTFHPWTKSATLPSTYTRTLTAAEFMLSMLNEYALGHNCPYLGATVSVQRAEGSSAAAAFSVEELTSKVTRAFVQTRWTYPIVASQLDGSKQIVYKVEDEAQVAQWAERTVQTVQSGGGWLGLQEKISQQDALPSKDGDCALLYLVVSPDEASKSQITKFDLLLHMHHSLADGTSLRSLMNDLLHSLAKPSLSTSYTWGEEVERLSPAALDVAILSDEVAKSISELPKEIPLPPLEKVQSPRAGTGLVTHTFKSDGFLNRLLALARTNSVKLTAFLQASLVLTAFNEAQSASSIEACTVLSAFDLRARNLVEPWNQRDKFIGVAVGLDMTQIPIALLSDASTDRLWALARHCQEHWDAVAGQQNIAAAGELRKAASGFILKSVLAEVNAPPSKTNLNLNYVSDPAGSAQLDGVYAFENDAQSKLVLDHYQLITDDSTSKLQVPIPPKTRIKLSERPANPNCNRSCRSHSWNDELTLSVSFNLGQHAKEEVQAFLGKWIQALEALVQ